MHKSERLSSSLTKTTVSIAILLSVLMSIIQISADYVNEKQSIDRRVEQLFAVSESTVRRSILMLDVLLAEQVTQGMIATGYIQSAIITDDLDNILAKKEAIFNKTPTDWISNLISKRISNYDYHFKNKPDSNEIQYSGNLALKIDNNAAFGDFYSRALTLFFWGIVRNIILAVVLISIFNRYISSPLFKMAQQFKDIDISKDKSPLINEENKALEFQVIAKQANNLLSHLYHLNNKLEEKVASRTEKLSKANQELEDTLSTLSKTQEQLFNEEKMSSLGRLVAGISHEINTPIGVAITSSSFQESINQETKEKLDNQTITQNDLKSYFEDSIESQRLVYRNLVRARELITSFKKVAVNREQEVIVTVSTEDFFADVRNTLIHELKDHQLIVNSNVDELTLNSGALVQIMQNLVLNSVIHGFVNNESGTINIDIAASDDEILINYKDNGIGLTEEQQHQYFEPFYTTKRNKGGMGLGAHIIYNLVTQALYGKANLVHKIDGFHIQIQLPRSTD